MFKNVMVNLFLRSFLFFWMAWQKKRNEPKKRKLTHIKKHSKYFQNKFCIHSITFQAVKIYFKNKLCLIKVTTAKPYYAYGVQGNLAFKIKKLKIFESVSNFLHARIDGQIVTLNLCMTFLKTI